MCPPVTDRVKITIHKDWNLFQNLIVDCPRSCSSKLSELAPSHHSCIILAVGKWIFSSFVMHNIYVFVHECTFLDFGDCHEKFGLFSPVVLGNFFYY